MKIGVVGLGLIGGSLLKDLRSKGHKLIGVSRSQNTIDKVISSNLVDIASTEISILSEAEIVFICTPINITLKTIDNVARVVSKECIITDVASLKGFVIDHINSKHEAVNFIGGHPMAGTENKGIDSSIDGLFDGAKWVLTPSDFSTQESFNKLKSLLETIGANVITADPHLHDRSVAVVSHFPMLLSQALFEMVESTGNDELKDLSKNLAASGFRDMTRLACSNTEMATDMIRMNNANIDECMEDLASCLKKLKNNYGVESLEKLVAKRKELYDDNGINVYKGK